MIQVNRIYLIFNRLVNQKFLVDTSDCLLQKTVQRYVKNTYPIHIKTKLPDSRQYRIGEFYLYQFSNPGLASMASFGMANV